MYAQVSPSTTRIQVTRKASALRVFWFVAGGLDGSGDNKQDDYERVVLPSLERDNTLELTTDGVVTAASPLPELTATPFLNSNPNFWGRGAAYLESSTLQGSNLNTVIWDS